MLSSRRRFVVEIRARGHVYLYYRRNGERVPLKGPEGSAAFDHSYDQAHHRFERPDSGPWGPYTVGRAITDYLSTADFQQLSPASQRQYRWALDFMRDRIGHVLVADIDSDWTDSLRNRLASNPNQWNAIRSRMREVFRLYRRRHPAMMPLNPWEEVRRLKVADSDQNRRWPDDVILTVLREATPEFRALLITLLLTAQRIGDVVQFTKSQYDPAQTSSVLRAAEDRQARFPSRTRCVGHHVRGNVRSAF
jgi:integrase